MEKKENEKILKVKTGTDSEEVKEKMSGESTEVRGDKKLKRRRNHTQKYKREVLEKVDQLRKNGESVGSYLRSEGLYQSSIDKWRKKSELSQPGTASTGGKISLEEKVRQLEKELAQVQKKLRKAELLVEIQKKISQMMDMDQPEAVPVKSGSK